VTPARLVIRADADAVTGLGHFRRCVSVGRALEHLGACWTVIARDGVVAGTLAGSERVIPLSTVPWSSGDAAEVASVCAAIAADWVIVDSYHAGADYLGSLKSSGVRVAVIHDRTLALPCDLLINAAADAAPLPSRVEETTFLLGPSFVPLGPDFWTAAPRRAGEPADRIILTFGGGDPRHLSTRLFSALIRELRRVRVTCLTGPFFDNHDDLHAAARHAQGRAIVVQSPASMADLFRAADVAISGGGQTVYELAAVGTPAVVIVMAENQRRQVEALAKQGIVRVAGDADEPGVVDRAIALASRLLDDPEARRRMIERGQELVDGRGALRIARALIDRVAQ
jgi:UDP-2,4-diacetamido-2,4,6-trideoxy-beta-L-altropyranose hydrolase